MMKKRPEITARTRKKLTDAFWQLYAKKDVGDIHISEITDLAGYHRGTFYEYFTDIYDLMAREEEALVKQLRHSKDAADAGEKVLFSEMIEFYRNNSGKVCLLLKRGDAAFLNQLRETLYPMFLEEYGLRDTDRARIIFEYGINGILMSLDYWYNHKDSIPLSVYLSTLQEMVSSGILPMLKTNGDPVKSL